MFDLKDIKTRHLHLGAWAQYILDVYTRSHACTIGFDFGEAFWLQGRFAQGGSFT